MYLNRALLIGNLTRDPELRSLPSGVQVASFSLATNRIWNDRDGKRQENTDYHNVVVFGKQGENCAQYLKKGSSALVEGRIQTRSWDADDGSKRYRTEIVADRVQFGSRPGGSEGGGHSSTPQNSAAATTPTQVSPKKKEDLDTIEYPGDEEEIDPDSIPF